MVGDSAGSRQSRTVVVPDRVYRAVTVFSTLFAIAAVVAGFAVLDAATDRATADLASVDPLVALLGVGLLIAGAAVYAFSTRFQAESRENANIETDQTETDG